MTSNGERIRDPEDGKRSLLEEQEGIRRTSKAIEFLTVENLKTIHEEIMIQTGDSPGISEHTESQLSFCVDFMQYGTYGYDPCPSLLEKAAYLMTFIASRQVFIDGNKRTAIASVAVFLDQNGYILEFTEEEAKSITLGIDKGSISFPQIVSWLKEHVRVDDTGKGR